MLSTLKSRLKVSLVSLILILSLTPVSPAHPHHSYSHEQRRVADNPNWMSVLPDSLHLSELSIPGTHETMSLYGPFGFRNSVMTQRMFLNLQLESGIRALDVRCAIAGNHFVIYHGRYYQNANFYDVLNTVIAFLQAHPRETVLMRVKEERTSDPEKFLVNFRETYWNNGRAIIGGRNIRYQDYIPMQMSRNPTLREMRGKIVILQDFARWQCLTDTSTASYGICYNSFVIQDEFQREVTQYNKWLAVKDYLDRASRGFDQDINNRDTKYINYLSGFGKLDFTGLPNPYFVVSGHVNPRTGASQMRTNIRDTSNQWPDFPRKRGYIYYEGTNTLVYDFIRNGTFTNRVGIIMTDFPGGGLIERIICINYPKTDPLCRRLPK